MPYVGGMMYHDIEQRYARQMALPTIGEAGQKILLASHVLVVGAGGLGSPLLLYLAAAGVGTIGIIDDDRVELSNLGRQIAFETSDVGRAKAEAAKDALLDINPDIDIITYSSRLSPNNAADIIADYDIVADGTDNFETHYLVADTCSLLEVPLVSAAVMGFSGQLSVFTPYLGKEFPCYRCWHPEPELGASDKTCSESGVLGSVVGIVGSYQATEVIKTLLSLGSGLSGHIMLINALENNIRKVKLSPDPACSCQTA